MPPIPPPAADAAAADEEDGRSREEQELARTEWLQYYLKVGDFEQAAELVVTATERDDLEYLRERAAREAR